jgi:hypothetical protein
VVVWLASFPRSGVTFLRHVIEQVYDLKTWTIYGNEAATTDTDGRAWPRDADPHSVQFVKAHPPSYAATQQPALHLVRDGRDVVVSYAHYLRLIGDKRPFAELLRHAVAGSDVCDHWGLHTMAWAARDVPRILFDDLIAAPVDTVCHAVGQLDVGLEPNTSASIKTFNELHEARPEFYRSGRAGGWRDVMSDGLHQEFWVRHGAAMEWLEALCRSRRSDRTRYGDVETRTCITGPSTSA